MAAYLRYGTPFAVIKLELDASYASGLSPAKAGGLIRAVAAHPRSELRLVDDVGRLHSGAFVVLLPQTGQNEADGVAARLRSGLQDSLGIPADAVHVQTHGSLDDLAMIEALIVQPAA